MLNGKLINSYPKNGKTMFVFSLTGSKEELSKYKEIKGEYYQEDETGSPLYWTNTPGGRVIKLKITTNDNVVEDNTDLQLDATIKAQADFTYNQVMHNLNVRAGQVGASPLKVVKDDKESIE